jgi:hypothetical protein
MKFIFPLGVLAMVATMGCGNGVKSPPTTAELSQIVERENNHYQSACQDRDRQDGVIDELEKLDRAVSSEAGEKAKAEIEQLEDYRHRLDIEVEQQAQLVADAKKMLEEVTAKK